jgi:hypothetical protein
MNASVQISIPIADYTIALVSSKIGFPWVIGDE